MHVLSVLWLPILLSAVAVFVISSLIHMVVKWHAGDYTSLPNEDAVRDAIRAGNAAPGCYVIPHCKEMKDMGSDAMKQKYAQGPVGHITLMPNGAPNMGKYLGMWFVLCLVISAIAAYLTAHVVPLDHAFAHRAAKLAGAISFIAYGFGSLTEAVWGGRPWMLTVKYLVDAALYALGTAAVFSWLWP